MKKLVSTGILFGSAAIIGLIASVPCAGAEPGSGMQYQPPDHSRGSTQYQQSAPRSQGSSRTYGSSHGSNGPSTYGSHGSSGPGTYSGSHGSSGPSTYSGSHGSSGPSTYSGSHGSSGPSTYSGSHGSGGPSIYGGSHVPSGPSTYGGSHGSSAPSTHGGTHYPTGPATYGGANVPGGHDHGRGPEDHHPGNHDRDHGYGGYPPGRKDYGYGDHGHGDNEHHGERDRYDWGKYRPGHRPPERERYAHHFDPRDYERIRRAEKRYRWYPYAWPKGSHYRRWSYGEYLPGTFWARRYWLNEYGKFGLFNPPYGYVWVRYGDDALLVDVENGRILTVVRDLFY